MKKLTTLETVSIILLVALLVLFTTVAKAEIAINSENDISGSWVLDKSSSTLDGPTVDRGETWIFSNGQLEKKGLLLARSGTYDVPPVPFKIESGKLLVSVVGRPGKFASFEMVDKDADAMVLHAKSEGFLFFQRQ